MPEMQLRQPTPLGKPRFTFNAHSPFTKTMKGLKKIMKIGDTWYIHRNDLDKVCFHHNMAYGIYKDFVKRLESD